MSHPALATLESALRARKLDRTLTTALLPPKSDGCVAATVVAGLDAALHGGLPRGQVSEIAGCPSSGRTTLLLQVLAAATRRGEIAALVDPLDRLDLASLGSAGMDLDRLLWIRGHDISRPQAPGLGPWAFVDRTIERALKAFNLVLQAGGFGVVALDVADAPLPALARIPFTTWLRVQRTIEGSDTACLVVGPQPLARSAGGLSLSLAGRPQWTGHDPSFQGHRLTGLNIAVRVVSPRRRVDGDVAVSAAIRD